MLKIKRNKERQSHKEMKRKGAQSFKRCGDK